MMREGAEIVLSVCVGKGGLLVGATHVLREREEPYHSLFAQNLQFRLKKQLHSTVPTHNGSLRFSHQLDSFITSKFTIDVSTLTGAPLSSQH